MFNFANISEGAIQALRTDPRFGGKPEEIKDPDKVFADVTQRQQDRYKRDFRPFENELVQQAQTDTSLLDAVPEDVAQQSQMHRHR